MTTSKVSQRKPPRLEKGAMICTRLILSAAIGAVINNGFQRGSERTICPGKWPNRTVRGGVHPALLTIPAQAPPGQSDNSNLLTKFNSDYDSNTRSSRHKSSHCSSNKKRMCPKWVHPLINYLDLYLSISSRILNSCACSSGVLADRNS